MQTVMSALVGSPSEPEPDALWNWASSSEKIREVLLFPFLCLKPFDAEVTERSDNLYPMSHNWGMPSHHINSLIQMTSTIRPLLDNSIVWTTTNELWQKWGKWKEDLLLLCALRGLCPSWRWRHGEMAAGACGTNWSHHGGPGRWAGCNVHRLMHHNLLPGGGPDLLKVSGPGEEAF